MLEGLQSGGHHLDFSLSAFGESAWDGAVMRDTCESGACAETSSPALDIKAVVSNGLTPLLADLQGGKQQHVSELSLGTGVTPNTPSEESGYELSDQENKIDLDAAYRAVNLALEGLDLGGKRFQQGTPVQSEQKSALPRGSVPQSFGYSGSALRRTRTWADDRQPFSLSEVLNPGDQLQQLQLQMQQGFQEPRFRPVQSGPPPVGCDVRYLGSVNDVCRVAQPYGSVGVAAFGRGYAADREVGGNSLGARSPIPANGWDGQDGFGCVRQQQCNVGYMTDYVQGLVPENEQFKRLDGSSAPIGFGPRRCASIPIPPLVSAITPEPLNELSAEGSLPYSLSSILNQPAPVYGGLGSSGELELNQTPGVVLPETLDSMDDGDLTKEPDILRDLYPCGKAADPRTKSEQALLLAITGILKCAVEGNLAHKDVLSDLYFLIVSVRRHLADYQNLSSEAAQTLALIWSTLPTACSIAHFDGDVIASLKRLVVVMSTGHPLLLSHSDCLNAYDPTSRCDPKKQSQVAHLLRQVHRKLTGGTTSTGVQHVALALFDAGGEKNSSPCVSSGIDGTGNGLAAKTLPRSVLAAQTTTAGSQSPGLSDGDASTSTTSALSFLDRTGNDVDPWGECATATAHAVLSLDDIDQ